jgi:hypothetical protein
MYLVLTEIVRKICNHHLCGGGDPIFRRTTLLRWARNARLLLFGCSIDNLIGFVGNVSQRKNFCSLAVLSSGLGNSQHLLMSSTLVVRIQHDRHGQIGRHDHGLFHGLDQILSCDLRHRL